MRCSTVYSKPSNKIKKKKNRWGCTQRETPSSAVHHVNDTNLKNALTGDEGLTLGIIPPNVRSLIPTTFDKKIIFSASGASVQTCTARHPLAVLTVRTITEKYWTVEIEVSDEEGTKGGRCTGM